MGGGGKQVDLSFYVFLVLQYLGVPKYPEAEKNSTRSVIVTPVFGDSIEPFGV